MMRIARVVLLLLLGAAPGSSLASPITYSSIGPAYVCVDEVDCIGPENMLLLPIGTFVPISTTGTMQIDPAALEFEFDIALPSIALTDVYGTPTGVELQGVRLLGVDHEFVAFSEDGRDSMIRGTAQVDGIAMDVGTPSPFAATAAFLA